MVDLAARDDHGDCCTMLRPSGGEPVTGQGVGPVTGKDFAAEVRLDHCPSRSSNFCKALSVPGPADSVKLLGGSALDLERPDAPLGGRRAPRGFQGRVREGLRQEMDNLLLERLHIGAQPLTEPLHHRGGELTRQRLPLACVQFGRQRHLRADPADGVGSLPPAARSDQSGL